VGDRRVLEGAGDQLPIEIGFVGLKLGEQFVDKILMPFEYRHEPILPLLGKEPSLGENRKPRLAAESSHPMFRRRRESRRLRLAARLLLALGRS
jgi:hypothetical protein